MKKLICALMIVTALGTAQAAELKWLTDLPKAQETARESKKLVLMNFTGSDWCHWCVKLKDEIFNTTEFTEYAAANLVLVELDFPRKKTQPEALKKANDALRKQYAIRGYPTVVVLDSGGKKLGELGYVRGGPKAFLAELAKLKN